MNRGALKGFADPPTVGQLIDIARLTSGTGNYVPKPATQWLKVTLIGGGAAGNSTSSVGTVCSGGLAAKPVTFWLKRTKRSYPYTIGAGGLGVATGAGNPGGNTTFDTLTAYGALGGLLNPQTPANSGGLLHGESSPYGQGGLTWAGGGSPNGGAASGHGAGGGGTSGGAGGAGSGGLILVEEY